MNNSADTLTYNQAVLECARAGLADLKASTQHKKAPRTAAQDSHFLCQWMVTALKEKRFSKQVADDLTAWVRLARSQGAGAELKLLLQRIVYQYEAVAQCESGLGTAVKSMLATLGQAGWLVFTDTLVSSKLKLDSDGQSSLVIDANAFAKAINAGELVKPLTLYVRADEQQLAQAAFSHGLLLSEGNKKASLVKHHKAYQLMPRNAHQALCLLLAYNHVGTK